ncbi:tellurite resistance TerB family protein [Siculibacillus lacustris]|nr:TerB family tellurite resistance protein [Siculibacillus lacustris]
MFDALKRFFADLAPEAPGEPWELDDPRLAVAALMFHLIAVDGCITPREMAGMEGELGRRYGLDAPQVRTLVAAARASTRESTDLQSFTAGLARRLPMAERHEVLASLLRVALIDGSLHEFEDDLVWRIADLLGIAPHERVAIRKRLEADQDDADARAGR